MSARIMRRLCAIGLTLFFMVGGGCGVGTLADFQNAVTGVDGRPIFLETVERISDNPNLNSDQKREQLRELGIEDEKLIDALLQL